MASDEEKARDVQTMIKGMLVGEDRYLSKAKKANKLVDALISHQYLPTITSYQAGVKPSVCEHLATLFEWKAILGLRLSSQPDVVFRHAVDAVAFHERHKMWNPEEIVPILAEGHYRHGQLNSAIGVYKVAFQGQLASLISQEWKNAHTPRVQELLAEHEATIMKHHVADAKSSERKPDSTTNTRSRFESKRNRLLARKPE